MPRTRWLPARGIRGMGCFGPLRRLAQTSGATRGLSIAPAPVLELPSMNPPLGCTRRLLHPPPSCYLCCSTCVVRRSTLHPRARASCHRPCYVIRRAAPRSIRPLPPCRNRSHGRASYASRATIRTFPEGSLGKDTATYHTYARASVAEDTIDAKERVKKSYPNGWS